MCNMFKDVVCGSYLNLSKNMIKIKCNSFLFSSFVSAIGWWPYFCLVGLVSFTIGLPIGIVILIAGKIAVGLLGWSIKRVDWYFFLPNILFIKPDNRDLVNVLILTLLHWPRYSNMLPLYTPYYYCHPYWTLFVWLFYPPAPSLYCFIPAMIYVKHHKFSVV